MVWKLAEAKNKFSKVVDMALTEGPQKIIRRDKTVVVMNFEEFERLTGKKKSFIEFLMGAPSSLADLDLTRDKSPMREVNLG